METTETTKETVIDLAPPSKLAPVFHVMGAARKINWTWYVTIGAFVGSMTLYMGQWQNPAPPKEIEQKYDTRDIPSFNRAELNKLEQEGINQHEDKLTGFLNEERQRITIAIALQFQGLAMQYISLPDHFCTGKSQLQCLNSFYPNRVATLKTLANRPSADEINNRIKLTNNRIAAANKAKNPQLVKQLTIQKNQLTTIQKKLRSSDAVFSPLLDNASELQKIEGLRLARILAIPAASRQPWEQNLIDRFYPLLNSQLPPEELYPRPARLARLFQESDKLRNELLNSSAEETTKVEDCLSLPPEQQQTCQQ